MQKENLMINRCLSTLDYLVITLLIMVSFPVQAHAYIGIALSAGGAVLVGLLVLSVLLALYVLIWFPIRRRLKEAKASKSDTNQETDHTTDESTPSE